MSSIPHSLASGNFTQDWTNTSLIMTNDDWSGAPSIVGYLGDVDTGSTADVDPRTRTAASPGSVDGIANQTNTTINNGGVAEFLIADPTVALQGSGTADAPSLVIFLDSTGRQDVRVQFTARDIDSTQAGGVEDNAAQQLAVQYRVGDAGEWTNVTLGYDGDVTSLGANEVTNFDLTLPATANNQGLLQVRILTTNAGGSDEWVGIDNIVVSSVEASQTVRFATDSVTVAQSEEDLGPTDFAFTVERVGSPAGDVNFTVHLTSTAANPADFNGSPALPFTINGTILAGQSTATVTVQVNGDSEIEVDEDFALTITGATNLLGHPIAVDTNQDTATGRILTDDFAGADVNGITILPEAASLQGAEHTPETTNAIELVRLGSYVATTGVTPGGAPTTGGNAEVVVFDPTSDKLYILNAFGNKIEIVQISAAGALTMTGEINLASLLNFGSANSVAVKGGIVAVAYGNTTADAAGYVALYDTATLTLQSIPPIQVGVLPDMLTFTPDGAKILVANEAEAISTTNNPNGTISIIDVSGGAASVTVQSTIGFTALNGSETNLDNSLGLALFDGQAAAADIEPEYIAVSPDGARAYVTLQEVNAVAVIDLTNPSATDPLAILPLGSIDRSLAGNQFDPSNTDGIDIGNWPVWSLLQPDAIATFMINGETYFVTANEGDARVGTGLTSEEQRVSAVDLDDATFPNEITLKDNANLGRLNIINHEGNTGGDADIDVITSYGGRGISIFKQNADGSITKVRETGGEFERILSQQPNANILFNGDNTFGSFDARSDDKGPEPESVEVGVVNGRTYVFVGLERAGGVMIYDVTDPANASFVGYEPPLPPTGTPSLENRPETVKFISAADSPTGMALIVTANEGDTNISAGGRATTVYAVTTPIYVLQGAGHTSAFTGQAVATTGVVTATDTNGFYIQDPNGDGNAATSDGIFVFTSSPPMVAVGQEVMVSGNVAEFRPGNPPPDGGLSITEITSPIVTVLGFGKTITPVEIGGTGHLVPPTTDLPAASAFWEALEGMLVRVNAPVAVAPTAEFSGGNFEIFTIVDNDDDPTNGLNATGLTPRGTLQIAPGTPVEDDAGTVGSDALRSTNTIGGDFNPERVQIQVDAGLTPGFIAPDVNPGARLSDVTGVVSYNFGNYEVVARQTFSVAQASTLVKETTTLAGSANQLTVASYNAENLDANDPISRFTTIADEVVNRLGSPDIIALQEVQDNNGAVGGLGSTVTSADQTLQQLVDAINAVAPAGVEYAFVDNPFIGDDTNGGEPGGNIRTAFLYRTDRVDFEEGSLQTIGVNGVAISGQDETQPDGNGDQQNNPENPFFGSRPPLVATFEFNGNEVTIVNNHFTSKGGSGALFGSEQPPLNASELQRAAQAQAVNNFVDNLLAGDPDAKIVVAGDLNEFPWEEPMEVLRGAATISNYDVPASNDPFDATATYTPGGMEVLHDLLEMLPANEQYDYVFEGNAQTLDHVLVTGSLQGGAQFDVVRINAEFADQTSDHDPLVASFLLEAPVNDAPVFTSSPAFVVAENNTAVGIVTANDPEGDSFTFALAGGDDQGFFDIDPNSGELQFLASPDFETRADADADNLYEVTISVTDEFGASDTQTVSVSVTNVVEPGRTITLGNGSQTEVGTTGNDTVSAGNGNDTIDGNDGDDFIFGGNGGDILVGGRGDDSLVGGNGHDNMDGGVGDDTLTGNNGHDVLAGGGGNDRLTGSNGNDLFVFGAGFGVDIVTDFGNGDRIRFDDELFQDVQSILAASQQIGDDVVITADIDNTITLAGVSLNSLQENDFLFT